MTSATEVGSRLEMSSRSGSLRTDTLQRFVFRRLINFFKWIFSTSSLSIVSSASWVDIVKYFVDCGENVSSFFCLTWLNEKCPYIEPLLPAENRNQFSVGLQGLKIIFIINFRPIRVQMNPWQWRLSKLLHRFPLKFAEISSYNRFLYFSCNVLDLWSWLK